MQKGYDSLSRPAGLHVAIIMDGNGRWATTRGLPRVAGHRTGAEAARRIIEAAPNLGITTLTLYAFSSDNWQRPRYEVETLMKLFNSYLQTETDRCVANGVKLNVIGRRDRLQSALREAIERAEAATVRGEVLHLRVAIDYSARDAILRAAGRVNGTKDLSREYFARLIGEADHTGGSAPDVDLLIRTGGEQRLSDFLLWECAYAELYFTKKMWPDFTPDDLETAIKEFHSRQRRFGRVPEAELFMRAEYEELAEVYA
ncbi:MAG: di-trans,poly-cis-decaprenylcistransferase [candidate division KSB1 bacterium]|nr:di-trans,poly-cis-decaprenylcistransferase [candidate division KSB1 bacterium]MDZ7301582.1 di-trans,poly-cis-decaprenylcistransferase [candidate division KSB1 bacterium]MDZ7311002.1 di-trans,poly-cis-decaprenylcistransferase [candidate division KSB1 bacterium]